MTQIETLFDEGKNLFKLQHYNEALVKIDELNQKYKNRSEAELH